MSADRTSTKTVTLAELRMNPQQYSGMTCSLVGFVDGLIASGRNSTIILRGPEGDKMFLRAPDAFGRIRPGDCLQVEVRVPVNNGYVDSLELLTARSTLPPPVPKRPPTNETGNVSTSVPSTASAVSSTASSAPAGDTGALITKDSATSRKRPPSAVDRSIQAVIGPYKRAIRIFNPRLSDAWATEIAKSIIQFSVQNGVDPRLTLAIIAVESGFRLNSTSRAGAMGLGQLMPSTAAGMGVTNAYDPVQNIAAAVRLISGHLKKYSKHPDGFYRALAAYNAGSGAVRKYGGVPPFRETVNYIWKIYYLYKQLAPDQFR